MEATYKKKPGATGGGARGTGGGGTGGTVSTKIQWMIKKNTSRESCIVEKKFFRNRKATGDFKKKKNRGSRLRSIQTTI